MPIHPPRDVFAPRRRAVVLGILTALVAVAGAGCSGDRGLGVPVSPSAMTTPASPTPGTLPIPAGTDLWRLTTTILSIDGSACFWTQPVGARFDQWTLGVEQRGQDVRFVYDVNNPHDNVAFMGTVTDRAFTATSDDHHGSWQCAPAVTFSSSVVGSFSSDGRTLSGRERLVYRVSGGSQLAVTLDWHATRSD